MDDDECDPGVMAEVYEARARAAKRRAGFRHMNDDDPPEFWVPGIAEGLDEEDEDERA
jgi:hypothetical protein